MQPQPMTLSFMHKTHILTVPFQLAGNGTTEGKKQGRTFGDFPLGNLAFAPVLAGVAVYILGFQA